jgi:molybdopterin-containing oxidoreductase family membrane subunit
MASPAKPRKPARRRGPSAETHPGESYAEVTEAIASIPLEFPQRRNWWLLFLAALALLAVYLVSATVLFARGVGVWGVNIPINWGLDITSYIWWLGLGHAGTLISAMLLLLRQDWRNSLNRFAEAMTLFAVVCAGLYPILHLGRPWYFYWMAPYPSSMGIWPQFRSPLAWDFFAVLTYLIVSALFWYLGIIPDLASVRDRARRRSAQVAYGLFALGWRGAASHWARWRRTYRLIAAIAVPLVVSVHSEISLLLAAAPVPGWNSTVFPPYFVLGAAFSGFAVVSMLAVTLRHGLNLQSLVTEEHLDLLGKLTLASGLMTGYGYLAEVFSALYSGEPAELAVLHYRLFGAGALSYWGAVVCNFVPLQALWLGRVRRSPVLLFAVGLSVAVGMWLERYMLVVSSLAHGFTPSSWLPYRPSGWEWSLFAGSLGLFLTAFLLFVRFLPIISASELKSGIKASEPGHG